MAPCGKKWLWQLTHPACGLGWFAGTQFWDCSPLQVTETPPMLVILLEWEQAVYNFPNPRPKLPLLGPQDHVRVPWWPHELWVVWKEDAQSSSRPRRGRGPASPCPPWVSLEPGRAQTTLSANCSRLSASMSEIKDPSFCLAPPGPGRPGLSSVQTLWHHWADCWGNL